MALFRRKQAQMESDGSGILAQLLPGYTSTSSKRGTKGLLEAYSSSPWVRSVISKVADIVGSTQWYLFATRSSAAGRFFRYRQLQQRRDGSTKGLKKILSDNVLGLDVELIPVVDHPMLRMLEGSNPVYPGHVGRSLTQVCIDLTGEAYWLLDPADNEVPESYWIIPPHWVTRLPTSSDSTWGVEGPNMKADFPIGAILRFVSPDPLNPYGRGSGHMNAFGDEIDVYEYASKHIRAWFQNRAVPDLLVTGEDMNQLSVDRVEQSWRAKLRGFKRAHTPFFLKAKGVTVSQLSQKFSDMELSQLRKDDRDTLIHGLGAPPEIFGILESSNRSTISAADYLMSRYVVVPRLELQRAFLEKFLLPIYDDRLVLAYESPVEEDSEFALEVMKSQPAAFKVNDWRKLAGEDLVEEDDDVFFIPFNVQPTSSLAPVTIPAPEIIEAPSTAGLKQGLKSPSKLTGHADDGSLGPLLETARDAELYARIKQIGGEDTARLALKLSKDMQKALLDAWETLRNELDLRQIQAALESGNIQSVLSTLDGATVDAAFADAVAILREAVVIVGTEAAAELADFLGETIAFDLINPAAVAELEEAGAAMVANVSDETISAVREALVRSLEEGRTSASAAKEIRDLVGLTERDVRQLARLRKEMEEAGVAEEKINAFLDKWTRNKIKYRAQTIADHELNRAGNMGQEQLWRQAQAEGLLPDDAMREWVVTPDDRLCVLCQPMTGVRVPVGQPFETNQGPVMTPQDLHVHCRCSERLVFQKRS